MKKKPILTESWLLFVYNNTERQKTLYRSAKAKDMKLKVLNHFLKIKLFSSELFNVIYIYYNLLSAESICKNEHLSLN